MRKRHQELDELHADAKLRRFVLQKRVIHVVCEAYKLVLLLVATLNRHIAFCAVAFGERERLRFKKHYFFVLLELFADFSTKTRRKRGCDRLQLIGGLETRGFVAVSDRYVLFEHDFFVRLRE